MGGNAPARPGDALRRVLATGIGYAGRHYDYPGQRAFSLVAHLLRRFPPSDDVVYRDADGYQRKARLCDHMESLVFVGRHRLPKTVMRGILPGDWVLDVGAAVGSVAGQLSQAVGKTGLVWAFEPMPRNLVRLTELADANSLSQLQIFDCALSSARGIESIHLPPEGYSGHASFTASWIDSGRLEVSTERLDDLTADMDETRPLRFMKLDVEGIEERVLEGAETTIRRFRPVIHCEFNDLILRDAGSSSEGLLRAFSGLGYEVAPGWERTRTHLAGRNVDLLMVPAAIMKGAHH